MKRIMLFVLSAAALLGQTLSLTCPTSVKAGTALNATTSIANAQGTVGVQYTATPSQPLGSLIASSIGSVAAANKATTTSGNSVIQIGSGPPGTLNKSLIADGNLANLNWTVPNSLANQNITITLAGPSPMPAAATDANGSPIQVIVNPACAVSVLPNTSLCDINGDGVTDQADVTAQKGLVMTFPQSSKCARDASGCGVTAIQIVINAALGGACTATQ